jgi:hypothetical protein
MATMLRMLVLAAASQVAAAWWRDLPPNERGEPPYPYPATHKVLNVV